MNINVHIERLILDGISVPNHQRPLLQAAVEAELARLLTTEGLNPDLLGGRVMPQLPAGSIPLAERNDPIQLGQQIAKTVYGGIGR